MDRRYLTLVRRWLWLVLLAALVGGVSAYLGSRAVRPTYQAETKLLVNAKQAPNALTYNDVLLSQMLTKTYSEMMVDPVMLQQVIQDGKLPYSLTTLKAMVTAAPGLQTQLITITAHAHTASEAALIANLVANTFIAQQRVRLASGAASDIISVVQPALLAPGPVSPRINLNTALGIVTGALFAVGILALLSYLDDTVKSQHDVDTVLQLPVLGLVASHRDESGMEVQSNTIRQHRHSAEAFRMVRANLEFATANNDARVLLITSAQKGEGKTTTACKLAITLAESGKRVILVDADLRLPRIHRAFTIDNRLGLTNLLVSHQAAVGDYVQPTPIPTLRMW